MEALVNCITLAYSYCQKIEFTIYDLRTRVYRHKHSVCGRRGYARSREARKGWLAKPTVVCRSV